MQRMCTESWVEWAFCVLNSRTFDLDDDLGGGGGGGKRRRGPLLAPLADVMNHCPPGEETVEISRGSGPGLACVAARDIGAGEPLQWPFSDFADDLYFLMYYGFTAPPPGQHAGALGSPSRRVSGEGVGALASLYLELDFGLDGGAAAGGAEKKAGGGKGGVENTHDEGRTKEEEAGAVAGGTAADGADEQQGTAAKDEVGLTADGAAAGGAGKQAKPAKDARNGKELKKTKQTKEGKKKNKAAGAGAAAGAAAAAAGGAGGGGLGDDPLSLVRRRLALRVQFAPSTVARPLCTQRSAGPRAEARSDATQSCVSVQALAAALRSIGLPATPQVAFPTTAANPLPGACSRARMQQPFSSCGLRVGLPSSWC